jgi:hypothetical protein
LPAGHILSTTAIAPTLWTDSFPPYAAVEPVLSDPQKPNDPVGFKEVFASDTEVGMHMQSLHNCLTPASNLQGNEHAVARHQAKHFQSQGNNKA